MVGQLRMVGKWQDCRVGVGSCQCIGGDREVEEAFRGDVAPKIPEATIA